MECQSANKIAGEWPGSSTLAHDPAQQRSKLNRVAKANIVVPASESDLVRGGFAETHLEVVRTNVEGTEVLHHGSMEPALGIEGAAFE